MDLKFWASTDVGRVREHNEDNFLVDKRMNLFVVCDGMGGHAAGEIASAISVRAVREVISQHREVFDRLKQEPENLANRRSVLNLIDHAIQEACQRVFQAAIDDPSRRGMGTTCSLLLLTEGRAFIGHVGDSRIYLHRQQQIHQITEDHSLVNEMIRLGKIQKGEEHNLPHKNAVTRAVGVNEFVEVDTFELDVFGGDCFLLCSDGLSGYFENDGQIAELTAEDDVKTATERCIDFANRAGGKDNITAIMVRVPGDAVKTEDIQRTMEVMRATPYFQYLGYKEMVQIVNLSHREEVAAGETVYAAGSDPEQMYLILRGKVILQREGQLVGTLLPGDHFGETALVDETPQELSAAAALDSVLLSIRRDRFMELLRKDPNLAVKLLWNFLQTFTIRLRTVPYETFLNSDHDAISDPTPPSGTLIFEEDLRRTEEAPMTSVKELSVSGAEVHPATSRRDQLETLPPGHLEPVSDEAIERAIRQEEGGAVGDQFSWEADPAEDLFSPDELRDTTQMEEFDPEEATATQNLADVKTKAKTPPKEPAQTVPPGPPISGSSMTRDAPKAQVLKRTKLIVGDEAPAAPDAETGEPSSLSERLEALRRKREPTLELDISDDGVEEIK